MYPAAQWYQNFASNIGMLLSRLMCMLTNGATMRYDPSYNPNVGPESVPRSMVLRSQYEWPMALAVSHPGFQRRYGRWVLAATIPITLLADLLYLVYDLALDIATVIIEVVTTVIVMTKSVMRPFVRAATRCMYVAGFSRVLTEVDEMPFMQAYTQTDTNLRKRLESIDAAHHAYVLSCQKRWAHYGRSMPTYE